MKTLFKHLTVIDKNSSWSNKKVDILIEHGRIAQIAEHIDADKDNQVINGEGQYITPGFFDIVGTIPSEDESFKEDYTSGLKAAQKGGYTQVLVLPNSDYPTQTKEQIAYLKSQSQGAVSLLPMAALTRDLKGEEMTELYDLSNSGAVAFTQNRSFVKKANVFKTCLEYSKIFDGRILSFPYDTSVNEGAFIHESESSVFMGLKGSPSFSELMGVQRDIAIAKYTDAPLHIACISTKESVEEIRMAKKNGVKITTSVAAQNVYFIDKDLEGFDVNLKVVPPIRGEEDRQAIVEGLIDGTIDCIVSNHHPQDFDAKYCEFSNAQFGALAYQTTLSAAFEILHDKVSLEDFVALFNKNPQTIFGEANKIEVGEIANLSLFSIQNEKVTFQKEEIISKSKNSPYISKSFSWKNIGVYNKNIWQAN
jgi:dihydroorotase